MLLAALVGRGAYLAHWLRGHAVSWRRSTPDASWCPGDIICDDCYQVLWCRSHDPWRVEATAPPDHWGAPLASRPVLRDRLQNILTLADACPPGMTGDELRRSACELIEAHSAAVQESSRHRMLTCIAHAERRYGDGRARSDDPSLVVLNALTRALGR